MPWIILAPFLAGLFAVASSPRFNLQARPRRYAVLCAAPGRRRGSAGGCGAVESLEELPRGPEMHVPLGRHVHGFSGSRIAARPGDPDLAGETPEPAQLHPMILAQGLGDLVQDRVERRLHGMR